MYHSRKILFVIGFLIMNVLYSQEEKNDTIPKKNYTTNSIGNNEPPIIDGILDDESWNVVDWASDYIQYEPEENVPPTEQTKFKIIYDEKNLYVAFRCYDKEPDKIVRRMSRRDGFEGDWVEINFDSYHDLRSGFSFTVSASGVKGDEAISLNGNNWDGSWDPIWYVKTQIDDEGWTAEMKIPLSQLRFGKSEEQVWGLQSTRRYFRNEERSLWQRIRRNGPGWVSEFGELRGLKNLKPQKQFEIQPYAVASLETYEEEDGNPFADGNDGKLNGGIDGKVGITNDLTLDFTINPDFGQVEADPSAIALDGFQIFFREQRPFFVQNKNIFNYQVANTQAGTDGGSDNLFYSRRIGRSPQGSIDTEDDEHLDQPDNTTILGAAKFSGKTKNGWSIGVLESITGNEYAKIDNGSSRREELVEPLTNYFVGRLQKDFNERNTYVGGIFTATNRDKLSENIDFLHKSAYSGGLDFKHQWKNRTWYLGGNVIMSHITGSEDAIKETQESITRLFQRVDASHVNIDSTRTSLSGHGGNLQFGKARGNLNFEGGVTWRSPELELNDVGFLRQADVITHYTWVGYKITKPFSIFRSMRFNYNHWSDWDFEGAHNRLSWNLNAHATFKNNWNIGTGGNFIPKNYSNTALRGGPKLRLTDVVNNWAYLNSDYRKKFRYGGETFFAWGEENSFKIDEYSLYFTYQPLNALTVSLNPSIRNNNHKLQFVDNLDTTNGIRYLNAEIDQKTFSMSLRLNYNINPNLTIQYWGQPFISRGRYSNFKYINNAQASNFGDRFIQYSDSQLSYNEENEEYTIDEDVNGTSDYSFDNPDFSFVEFRSNLVLRWEYIPGSEIYLVWSQGVSQSGNPQDNLYRALDDNIFGSQPQNIFLVKATYRFVL